MDDGQPSTRTSPRTRAERPSSIEARSPAPAHHAVEASRAGAGTRAFDQAAIRAQLRRWIVAHARAPAHELTDQTLILETGLLSSLDVVELVLFVEELRGVEIDTDDIEPDVFTSVDALWEGLFASVA